MNATMYSYFIVVLAVIFYHVQSKYKEPYEQDRTKVEELFKKIHPGEYWLTRFRNNRIDE